MDADANKTAIPPAANLNWRNRLPLFLAMAVVLTGLYPLLGHPDSAIRLGDWDMFLAFYEAVRKSIVEFGQFPFWNPWHFGGTPLFARPQIAVFSLETLCCLTFGTVYGLRLAVVLYMMFGTCGMWLLLGQYVKSPVSRFWGCVIFGLQGTIAMHIAVGHIVMIPIVFLPWLLFFLKSIENSRASALLLGATAAMLINHSLHYISLMIVVCLVLFCLTKLIRDFSRELLIRFILAALVFLALGGYRLIVTLDLLSEFPRRIDMRPDVPLHTYLLGLLYPGQGVNAFPGPLKYYWGWNEIGCYVGAIALSMFVVSLIRKICWWHWGFVIASLLTVNSSSRFLPGYWLRELPAFSSFFCITRWRFMAVFFISVGAAAGFDWLLNKTKCRPARYRLYFLLLLSTAALIYNQHATWNSVSWQSEQQMLDSVKNSSDSIITVQNSSYNRYGAVRKNVARVFSYEPLMGYSTHYSTKRCAMPNRNYRGEFVALSGNLRNIGWSPDLIELSTDRNSTVMINQNPGNYWRNADGQLLFPGLKAFEPHQPFIIKLPGPGTSTLFLKPRLHEVALAVSICSGVALLLILSASGYVKRLHLTRSPK